MFTRDELLAKYNITEEEFEHAEMTWDDLGNNLASVSLLSGTPDNSRIYSKALEMCGVNNFEWIFIILHRKLIDFKLLVCYSIEYIESKE